MRLHKIRMSGRIFLGIWLIIGLFSCSVESEKPVDSSSDESVLIPAGEFTMGVQGDTGDNPAHEVWIDSFYMDKHEVTNAQYFEFCQATGRTLPEFWDKQGFRSSLKFPNHPVVGVSWIDAKAYAEWRGKRLPTEAEWEYAARGGLKDRNYPNGDSLDPSLANFSQSKKGGPVAVGSYSSNGFGLFDMTGNVVEWVADFYSQDYYLQNPKKNPKGPEKGKFRVIRGGGWHSGPFCNRVYFRNALPANWLDFNVGFRCAKDIPKE